MDEKVTKVKILFQQITLSDKSCTPTFQDYPGLPRTHTKSPSPHVSHQISQSHVRLIEYPSVPCGSSNLPDLKESSNLS